MNETEETYGHEEDPLGDGVKTEDEEIPFEIKDEDDVGFGNPNIDPRAGCGGLETESCEIPYGDVRPASSSHTVEPEHGEILSVFEIKVENGPDAGNAGTEEHADWGELKTGPREIMFVRPTFPQPANSQVYEWNVGLGDKLAGNMIITAEESDPLTDVLQYDNLSEDERNLNEFGIEIKVENDFEDEDENSNAEKQVGWEGLKIDPSEITSMEISSTSSERCSSSEHLVQPAKKMKLTLEEANQSHIDVRYPSIERCGFAQITKQLIEFCPMIERKANILAKKFLRALLERVFNAAQGKKLYLYQLRLMAVELASAMDLAGFTPDDEWFISFKNQLPSDFFPQCKQKPVNYDETLSRLGINNESTRKNKSRDEIFKQLAKWYHEEADKQIPSPGQLERVACNIAVEKGLGTRFLSKDDVLLFVGQQGLYCNINGKISRLMEVKRGLFGSLFEARVEAWYHGWPRSTDDLLQDIQYLGGKHWHMFKAYLAILSEWLVEGQCHLNLIMMGDTCCLSLDSSSVVKAEIQFFVAVFGRKIHEVYFEFHKVFKAMLKAEIHKIRSFNSKFGVKYCYRAYTLCSDHLKKNANELALDIGLSEVAITKNWLRRFAELTVACSLNPDKSHNHPNDPENYFPVSSEEFDVAFENWYVDGSPKNEVAHSCIAAGSMEPSSLQGRGFSSTLTRDRRLDREVDMWYQKHYMKSFVKSYELKEKSEEIARLIGLPAFEATKSWMKTVLTRNGMSYYNEIDGTFTLFECRSLHLRGEEFEESFEAWYREGSCAKCAKRVDYRLRSETRSDKKPEAPPLSLDESVVQDWFVETSSSCSISPGELEKAAMDILYTEGFFPSKAWIEAFISKHGLCFNVKGDRLLFFSSEFEILQCKFLCEFERWYYQWPLSLDESLNEPAANANFELYQQALLNWYLKVSRIGKISMHDIITKSIAIIRKKMPGITVEEVDVWTDHWLRQCRDVVRRLQGFDEAMRAWYLENRQARYITPEDMRLEAEKCANKKMGFPNFRATELWLMRFVERYGVYFFPGGFPRFLTSVDILGVHEFRKLFTAWCDYKPEGGGSKESSVVVSETYLEPSSSNQNSRQTKNVGVTSGNHHKTRISEFEAEVVSWYRTSTKTHHVTSGQYLEKLMGIRIHPNLTKYAGLTLGFEHRKNCIRKLVEIHGIQVQRLKTHKFANAACGILKWRFDLAFEIWYYAFPLRVEDVRVDDCPLDVRDQHLIKCYLSTLHDWYHGRTKDPVSAEEIRAKEVEIVNSLTPSKCKHDLISRWCLKWETHSVAWIEGITKLDSELSSWYRARKSFVRPKDIQEQAEKTAKNLNIKVFTVTKTWLRRFVELHGLHFMYMGVLRDFSGLACDSLKPSWFSFGKYFEEWLETDEKGA